MVKVLFVKDGPEPTRGGPAYRLSLTDCIEHIGLVKDQWLSAPDRRPRFNVDKAKLSDFIGYQHVVCEIADVEAAERGMKAVFYRLELSPEEVVTRLGPSQTR